MRSVLAALVALALLPLAAAESPRAFASQAYTASPAGASCAQIGTLACPEIAVSHVQFGPFAATRVDVHVHDATHVKIGAAYSFYDAIGRLRSNGGLCEYAHDLAVPAGASYFVIEIDSPAPEHHCHPLVSYGTTGNVTFEIRS